MSVLDIRDLTVRFGGLVAVNKVDLRIEDGQIFSLIGPNGAGKTTVFNAVTGVYPPTAGRILFGNQVLERPLTRRVIAGIAVVGLLVGTMLALGFYVQSLWTETIEAHYRFKQVFPWGAAFLSYGRFVGGHAGGMAANFLAGAAIGAAGAALVWRRQRRAPAVVARSGVRRTFQNIRLFQDLTVLENVLTGMDPDLTSRIWHIVLRLPRFRKEEAAARARGCDLLDVVALGRLEHMLARNLSYGDQRRLEIARALATNPKLLLLDEPAAGMNSTETTELMSLIRRIRDRGVTVLLIEHHMNVVMGISDRIVVLDYGTKIAEGTPDEVRAHPAVIEAYLGKDDDEVTLASPS